VVGSRWDWEEISRRWSSRGRLNREVAALGTVNLYISGGSTV
jgi:hypothetical protein